MPVDVSSIEITELARVLEERKNGNRMPTLILGSRSGGLFRSPYLKETMRGYSKRTFDDLSQLEQFSECYSILTQGLFSLNDIKAILKPALHNVNHSIADDCVAELVRQGFFKVIVSANADDLLEQALLMSEMKELQDFIFFDLERHSVEDILFHKKPKACKLIKLNGGLEAKAYSLRKPAVQVTSMKNLLAKLQMRTKEVLVVGMDPTWDAGILSALPEEAETIWLVSEDESVKDTLIAQYPRVKNIRYVIGIDGSYEQFFKGMYWHINREIPRNYELVLEVINQQRKLLSEIQQLKDLISDLSSDIKHLKNKWGNHNGDTH